MPKNCNDCKTLDTLVIGSPGVGVFENTNHLTILSLEAEKWAFKVAASFYEVNWEGVTSQLSVVVLSSNIDHFQDHPKVVWSGKKKFQIPFHLTTRGPFYLFLRPNFDPMDWAQPQQVSKKFLRHILALVLPFNMQY